MRWRRRSEKRVDDLAREIRSHLELEAEEQIGNGHSAEEAKHEARRAFGNPASIMEQVRDAQQWRWLDDLKRDLLHALRAFARTPGFTAVVIATLALGIGATSATFSIVNTVWLHPLPYPNADRLVAIWQTPKRNPKAVPFFNSYRDFEVWKARSRSFDQLAPATWATGHQILTGSGPARDVLAMPVGPGFFPLLGANPVLGRFFEAGDLNHGCTVVLKYQFWLKSFGGRKDVVGQHIELNRKACTILGVTAPSFTFYPDAISMWMLITPESEIARDPENANVGVFGLLKPGVSIERAQRELAALFANLHSNDPRGAARTAVVFPLAEQFDYLTGPTLRRSVIVLFTAVSFVLLIACLNIANLLLGRSLARQKELAVRASLGSGRLRLIRQLLAECLLLSFSGACVGILLVVCALHYFRVLSPIAMPPGNAVGVNLYVLMFAAALAVVTALTFGLIPASRASRVDLVEVLKAGARTASLGPSARIFAKLLVAAQVTLSLALLAGAGLLIESVDRLSSVPLGFDTRVVTLSMELPAWSYSNAVQRTSFYLEALDSAATLPGVEAAAFASSLPLNSGRWGQYLLAVEGRRRPDPATDAPDVTQPSVTPGYFHVMGVPLVAGRLFDGRDQAESEPVAIVNRALVRKYFPHERPIGARIQIGDSSNASPWITIIGVVADEKDRNFFREMEWEDIPAVFRPFSQAPPARASLLIRAAGSEMALGVAIQKQIASLDNNIPLGEIQRLDHRLSEVLAYPRFRAAVLGFFSALALLLASIGLYGVISHLTAQRTQEFGVRMALGAQRREVLALVIRQGLALTVIGLLAGLLLVLCLARLLNGLLYGVAPSDPYILAGVSAVLVLVSVFATYVPARRAANVDPISALKYE